MLVPASILIAVAMVCLTDIILLDWRRDGAKGMNKQSWKTAVEIEDFGGKPFVRVIEDGIVKVRAFKTEAEANAFALSEKARLGLDR